MRLNIPTVCARVSAYHERIRPYVLQPNAELQAFTSLGCYPIFYLDSYSDVLCPTCATNAHEYGEVITHADINWEDPDLWCEHCNERIEAAYT